MNDHDAIAAYMREKGVRYDLGMTVTESDRVMAQRLRNLKWPPDRILAWLRKDPLDPPAR